MNQLSLRKYQMKFKKEKFHKEFKEEVLFNPIFNNKFKKGILRLRKKD